MQLLSGFVYHMLDSHKRVIMLKDCNSGYTMGLVCQYV